MEDTTLYLFFIYYLFCFKTWTLFLIFIYVIWSSFLGDQIKLYFVEAGADGIFSTRNELESLNTIPSSFNCLIGVAEPKEKSVLQLLKDLTYNKINEIGYFVLWQSVH